MISLAPPWLVDNGAAARKTLEKQGFFERFSVAIRTVMNPLPKKTAFHVANFHEMT